ncbi:acyltransferase [Methanobrevibacter sp.]|uniref:acyltransferase n=1 Tax=Methanobrevibacter sp. TaxID=66852 RepID=UPI002E772C36|nr:acyltransferase [Methanobrevibacter sp.]MEE1335139.1 acyltransferase [Methanobrevibacter sp.]
MGKTRIEWIDLVRAIAILTVLYIHATDGIYIISSDAIMNYTTFSRIFNFASLFIGRIGVPFFLMITGYLLLDRTYNDERIRKFWKNNCKGLIIVTIIWSVIYAISLQFISFGSSQVNFSEAGNLFFSHMWYMPMIIGMYLSMPFVSSALEKFSSDTIWQATIVFSLLAFLLPFISLVLAMNGIENVSIQYCLGFSGGIYGIYIILGYLVKKGQFKHFDNIKLGLITLISFMICLFFQYYAFTKGYDFQLWYEFPFVLTGSFALFELCSRMDTVRAYPMVAFLSKYSFAVFLVHNLFRLPLLPVVVQLPFTEPVKAIILWVLLIIFSYTAVVIIYRIPRFGKYILYMR